MTATAPLYSDDDAKRQVGVQRDKQVEPFRTEWRRDIARLIHSPAFRRLQGKTQVFPGHDADFFRNRLTHSMEVAQIAKSIAIRLNATNPAFEDQSQKIEPDIVEFAALAHDLGHPPFGHNGEMALDEEMADYGGFEGNAQTLRILTKVEKKEFEPSEDNERCHITSAGVDCRAGLNLTSRCLASILKYDEMIKDRSDERSSKSDIQKGYYSSEKSIVDRIKKDVLGNTFDGELKTIECSIMDIADDISYSTYDMEDCFKAKILTPLDLFSLDDTIYDKVCAIINKRLDFYYSDITDIKKIHLQNRIFT